MKTRCILFVWILFCGWLQAGERELWEKSFQDPPMAARPWVYWFIMDGNLSREGITADLESMAQAGIGGAIVMEVSVGIPRGEVEFMSDRWCELFRHAVCEAERLGMQITLNAGPGWTGSGGPWVKVEQSMQHLVSSSVLVTGPARYDGPLPMPEPREPYFGSAGLPDWLLQDRRRFYEDEAVLAVPTRAVTGRLQDLDEKALYRRDPYSSMPGVKAYLPSRAAYDEVPASDLVRRDDIIDLTDRLKKDGRLEWDIPAGSWTILRFGRRTTGANTRPAPVPGLGFESDKFDAQALEAHYEQYVTKLLEKIGRRPTDRTTGWTSLHIDSWEMGAQNWSAKFPEYFQQQCGYDPRPYLPVLAGRIVDSVEVSERFLWDLRQVAQHVVLEQHARHLKELGRRDGFGLSIEPYDMNPTCDMMLGSVADVPMCEFWAQGFGFDTRFSCYESASVAHTLGREIVAAEAFTAVDSEAWQLYPWLMKNQGDWAFCTGINRIVFHRYAHQPWLDRRPGMTMGPYGVHWDRTQTWWPMVNAYHEYLARCQYLLRQGNTVADICYLAAEGAPHVFRPPTSALQGQLGDRRGYNFDGCTPATLLEGARVEQNRVVLPSGAAYELLVLPQCETMTPVLLTKIKQLVEAGATVVGPPPVQSPGLKDFPECDKQVENLAKTLWGSDRSGVAVHRRVGEGEIIWGPQLFAAGHAPNAEEPIEQAKWIWYPGGNPAAGEVPCARYFRRIWDLPEGKAIATAQLQMTADNSCVAWINGQEAGRADNFHLAPRFDVTTLLKPGSNLVAVEAKNGGDNPNPAGLIVALAVTFQDGTSVCLASDGQWQSAQDPATHWQQSTEGEGTWVAAAELGASDMAPWALKPQVDPCPPLYPEYQATAEVLRGKGIEPDFESDGPVRYTHRRTEEADIYFVANTSGQQITTECQLRVAGGEPELWDPVTGEQRRLSECSQHGNRLAIPLRFEPYQSFFVVVDRVAAASEPQTKSSKNYRDIAVVTTLEGPWEVTFPASVGGVARTEPITATFAQLQDWTDRDEPTIRHYSGIATYRRQFDMPATLEPPCDSIWLDLGAVQCLARVRLNGKDLGVVWCAPWRVEITSALQARDNQLEIEVANLWPNRLIGDAGLPPEKRMAWSTWSPYTKDSPLLSSGLLGPVRIMKSQ